MPTQRILQQILFVVVAVTLTGSSGIEDKQSTLTEVHPTIPPSPEALNPEGTWTTGASVIPTARYYAGSVTYTRNDTGWLYIFGGDTTGGGVPTRTCSRYNINTNTWSFIAPLPIPLRLNAAARLGNKLYSIGGFSTSTVAPVPNVYEYDVLTNTWAQRASLPVGVFFGRAMGYEDSLIYLAGGIDTVSTTEIDRFRHHVTMYNVNLDEWREADPMPGARADGGFTISKSFGKMFYLGGFTDPTTLSANLFEGTINPLNKAQISWTLRADYPLGVRARFNVYEWGSDKIIIGGGSSSGFNASNEFYLYDINMNNYWMIPSKQIPMTAYQGGPAYFEQTRLSGGTTVTAKLVIAGGVTTGPALSSATQIYTDTVMIVDVDNRNQELPGEFVLFQNYPNPFNPVTEIRYQIPVPSHIMITAFDLLGREVATLVNEIQDAGFKSVEFRAEDLASGVYLYRLTARAINGTQAFTSVKKMVVMK